MSTPSPQNVDPIGDDEVADVDDAPKQAFAEAMSQFGEFKEYAAQYVSAKIDLARLSLRKAIILAAVGILALFAGSAAIITLIVLLLKGLSELVATWLGGRAWAGDLIVGGGLLLALVAAGWISIHRLSMAWRDATMKRYERRRTRQKIQHEGHDAQQRGDEYASKSTYGN